MKTREITVTIKADVPHGKYCTGCTALGYHTEDSCDLFPRGSINWDLEKRQWLKCQQCLDACANGTEQALKELAE